MGVHFTALLPELAEGYTRSSTHAHTQNTRTHTHTHRRIHTYTESHLSLSSQPSPSKTSTKTKTSSLHPIFSLHIFSLTVYFFLTFSYFFTLSSSFFAHSHILILNRIKFSERDLNKMISLLLCQLRPIPCHTQKHTGTPSLLDLGRISWQ